MSLKVIGSGFGRTGTMSTKLALERLGFGPCHHMVEVMGNPAQPAVWKAVAAGEPVDWRKAFDGYVSQVDWPGASVWAQTMDAFPEAKVVHTERPEDAWWNSFSVTIGKFFSNADRLDLPPHFRDIFETMVDVFLKKTFEDHTDRDCAIAAYRANNSRVRETVPADRLLVFDVAEGWAPLCRFLDVPTPEGPFPRSNPRDEFWAHFGGEPG
ncbi:MAG: sulfotransferase [Alphaproteobacteria bacterium]